MERKKEQNLTAAESYKRSKFNAFEVTEPIQLMDFIMRAMDGISRTKAKAILAGGGVTVDRQKVTQFDFELKPGMAVDIRKHKKSSELQNKFVKIVYEDKWLVLIEKADGILSMGSNTNQFSVKSVLDQYFKKKHLKCTAHVVHRLDRETSGLMIYAKDRDTEQILEEYWHDIVTDRRYVAVVNGVMEQESGTVESWLKDNKSYITYSSPTDNGGKFAVTHYRTLKSNDQYSLMDLKLETGRKNQIRVHMQDLGHPVVGDAKYGNIASPIHRMALHAYSLDFIHPITHERLEFETPFPRGFVALVK